MSFTALLDRGLPAEAALAAWCPTRDLLALATDGQLHLHRLNWQRLWWQSPEAPITGAPGPSRGPGAPAGRWGGGARPRDRRQAARVAPAAARSGAACRCTLTPARPPPAHPSAPPPAQRSSGAPTASSWRWGWRTARCCC